MSSGPAPCVAAARWGGFRSSRKSIRGSSCRALRLIEREVDEDYHSPSANARSCPSHTGYGSLDEPAPTKDNSLSASLTDGSSQLPAHQVANRCGKRPPVKNASRRKLS